MSSEILKGERVKALSPFALAITAMLLVATAACAGEVSEVEPTEVPVEAKTIQDTLVEYTFELMMLPGVLGVGIGECAEEPCIQIMVARLSEELNERLPHTLNGYPVEAVAAGNIDALIRN